VFDGSERTIKEFNPILVSGDLILDYPGLAEFQKITLVKDMGAPKAKLL